MEPGSYEMNYLKRVLNKYFTPHAAVFSSDRVKKIFEKYGLTPAEFLRPFGRYNGTINYNPFPNNNNYMPVEISNFRLEFYDDDSFYGFPETPKVIEHILQSYKPQISLEEKDWALKENLEQLELLNTYTYNTIWYRKWEECFLDT